MTETRTSASNIIASQVSELSKAAAADAVLRKQRSAERVKHDAAVDAWLSRKRAVLMSFIIAVPVFAAVIAVNVMNVSFVDLLAPAPAPDVARLLSQEALDTVVKRVDTFYSDYGELPPSLIEVGLPPHGSWTWAPRGNGQYQVTVRMYGKTLTFDTGTRPPSL